MHTPPVEIYDGIWKKVGEFRKNIRLLENEVISADLVDEDSDDPDDTDGKFREACLNMVDLAESADAFDAFVASARAREWWLRKLLQTIYWDKPARHRWAHAATSTTSSATSRIPWNPWNPWNPGS